MKAKPYKAKTLSGAQAYVRMLLKQRAERTELLERYAKERRLLARLAADTPQFSNPMEVWEAKKVSDEILRGVR